MTKKTCCLSSLGMMDTSLPLPRASLSSRHRHASTAEPCFCKDCAGIGGAQKHSDLPFACRMGHD